MGSVVIVSAEDAAEHPTESNTNRNEAEGFSGGEYVARPEGGELVMTVVAFIVIKKKKA